jgi:hypothetical protein
MTGLTATVAGVDYDLNDGEEIRLLDWDLSLPPARRLSQRAPGQLGDTDLGYRGDPRFLDLFWVTNGANASGYRDLRETFLTVFLPRAEDAVVLTFDFGGGIERALDVHLDGELLWSDRVRWVEKVSGVFKASDPRLYDPDINTVQFSLVGSGGSALGWEIPWEIPWEIGAATLYDTASISYASASRLAAPEYPVIQIVGPIANPVITNQTTDEVIDLSGGDGLSLADSSEYVEIDLDNAPRRDAKTIRDQDGDSVDQYLTTDSDLATWHLAPAGERLADDSYATGTNVIVVEGDDVTADTLVTMRYYDRYWGI